jgi:1-acyl-sn-glycerol-3-phosphate acyltransferase
VRALLGNRGAEGRGGLARRIAGVDWAPSPGSSPERESQAGEPSGTVAYRMAKALTASALRRCYRVDVKGLAHVPDRGPMVLAANHRSFMDSIFLALVTPRPITFIAKAEYFDSWRTAWAFRATGQIPLRRGSPTGARQALATAGGVLARRGIVGVYPEGTRSRDGRLQPGNTGPARLALASGAPIVPVGLVGTDAVQAPGESLPHLFRAVTVRFGPPLHVTKAERVRSRKAELRGATERLMSSIADLCGQEYGVVRASDALVEPEHGADA